jgi:TrmH family RNA methyltransferase
LFGSFKIADKKPIINTGLIVAALGDPGNMGTILRLCDWFGVQQVVCSKETVDLYNQKWCKQLWGLSLELMLVILT